MQQCVHCLDYGTNIRFRAGSANPHPAGCLRQLFGQMDGDHQDGDFREKSRDLPGNLESVEIGHLEIQQNHIGRIIFYPLQRFPSGSSLVANLPGALLLEESPKIVPDRRIIVYDKNSNQAVTSPRSQVKGNFSGALATIGVPVARSQYRNSLSNGLVTGLTTAAARTLGFGNSKSR